MQCTRAAKSGVFTWQVSRRGRVIADVIHLNEQMTDRFRGFHAHTIKKLRNPNEVTELAFAGIKGVELTELTAFTNLTRLELNGFYHTGSSPDWSDTISDFTCLARFPRLRHLRIHDCRFFDDQQLLSLATSTSLHSLSITSFMHSITDFSAISKFKELQMLQLTNVSDIGFLSSLHQLQHVYFSDKWSEKALTNFESLTHLPLLKSVTFNSLYLREISLKLNCDYKFWYGQDSKEHDWWRNHFPAIGG